LKAERRKAKVIAESLKGKERVISHLNLVPSPFQGTAKRFKQVELFHETIRNNCCLPLCYRSFRRCWAGNQKMPLEGLRVGI